MLARLTFVLCLFGATAAWADPCKAIPDDGPMPEVAKSGRTFSGRVVHVGDGDGLCVATGVGQNTWIEVRLADFYAPELNEPGGEAARKALSRIALFRQVTCEAQKRSYDRVVAVCRRGGESLGELMRQAGVGQGGRAYQRR